MRTLSNEFGRSPSRPSAHCAELVLFCALAGCQGSIGNALDEPAGGSASPTNNVPGGSASNSGIEALNCTSPSPGASPIRRITRFEYSNTVHDLLGDATRAGDLLPPEEKGNGFSNDASTITTTRLLVDAYRSVAHDLAHTATSTAAQLARLSNCDPAAQGEDVCATKFVDDFGPRAFRRPLESAEHDAMIGVFQANRAGATYADGIAAVIEMALQSPQFLYRVELGTPVAGTQLARPTSYEMATRLSYLLWGSMPDDKLAAAAAAGQLETKEQVLSQATVMLDDPRARDVVRYFHDTLYGINGLDGLQRDTTFFPTYTTDLAALFRQETEHFVDSVVWDGAGNFATMMNAPFTFLNGTLAKFYGVSGITGDAFQRAALDPARRAGVLTQASLLTMTTPGSHNNPVVRGKFIYTQLLCGEVPDPPPGLMVKEPEADPTRTTRERFIAHRTSASCASCHVKLDSIGFGLEHYNGVGLWQDLDNGKPIDATGHVPDGDAAGDFNGGVELANKIAKSHDAAECYVGKWLDFAYGRLEEKGDGCTHQSLSKAFQSSGGNVKNLLLALTQTDDFLYRPGTLP
jgi:hypothetical protein